MHTDVLIVGSGQAAPPLATRLAKLGKKVVLAERNFLGGTCVNTGCTPTKSMIASAEAAHVARTAERLGVHVGRVEVDFRAVIARKDAIVRRFREGLEKKVRAAGENLRLVHGHARFVGPHEVEIAGERFEADNIVINVGTRSRVPPIAGLSKTPFLDNATLMELRELPAHLIVLGGGYIGCEFGQMFRRFGSKVTIVHRGERLLDHGDPAASPIIEDVFRREGIALELGVPNENVSGSSGEILIRLASGKEVRGSHLLVATGRRPNTDDLGCDAAGIALDKAGYIVAGDHYETSVPGVYAVADVLGGPQFTHVSWDDSRILFDILTGRSARGRCGRSVPYTVFTDPQVAGVGLTEHEASSKGIAYELATMPFAEIARAVETGKTDGVLKVLVDPKTERVLGATLIGAEAGELLHIFVALIEARASVRAIVDSEAVHPTFAEGIQSLVMRLPRFALS